MDDVPESGSDRAVVSMAPPAMRPLHDTRAMADVLPDVARQLGGRVGAALPWQSYEEALRAADNLARVRGASAPFMYAA